MKLRASYWRLQPAIGVVSVSTGSNATYHTAFVPSAVEPLGLGVIGKAQGIFYGDEMTKFNASRQAVAGIITRQILQAGFAECKRNPDKTRIEVFAETVKSFEDVLKPWGFAATSEPGPRSRGGIRVVVKG